MKRFLIYILLPALLGAVFVMACHEEKGKPQNKGDNEIEQKPAELKLIAVDEKTGCRLYAVNRGLPYKTVYWSVCHEPHSNNISSSVAAH